MIYTEKGALAQAAAQEKQFDALYRRTAQTFGLPDCSMWVLYFLTDSELPMTQQDLAEKMMFPKQTINSAVLSLAKRGWLELQMIPGTRNRKRILLTPSGRAAAQQSVQRLRAAEEKAVQRMGEEQMRQFLELYRTFFLALQQEFQREGLTDGGPY